MLVSDSPPFFFLSSIPPNLPTPGVPQAAAPAVAPTYASGPVADPAASGSGEGNTLAELRNHPHFNQLRQLVRDNPAALEGALQQIVAQSPPLLEAIRANTAEFLQMLSEPVAAPLAPAHGAHVAELSQEEAAAVQRLQGRFSKQEAVEAYLVCDKNEEAAANFLFDGMGGGGGG